MSNSCQNYRLFNTLFLLVKYSSPLKQLPPPPPHGVRTKPSHLQSTLTHCLVLDLQQHLHTVLSCIYNTYTVSSWIYNIYVFSSRV